MATKSMKRIHKVVIKRMIDESPDTSHLGTYANQPDSDYSIDRAHSRDCRSIQTQDDAAECDCGFSGYWNNQEFRYFNPNWQNYKGLPAEEIRKYCDQDYKRMESLGDDWYYIGIRAKAEYSIGESRGGCLIQDITSGGLWGIESDSDESYFVEVEQEELADLRTQLEGIGFSKRAIAAAFKAIEHVEG